MTKLDDEPDVVGLSERLAVRAPDGPVAAIVAFCNEKVDRWVTEEPGALDIASVEALVARRLQLVVEEIWSDADFERLKAKYIPKREFVFAALQMQFDDSTFGLLIRRKNATLDDPDRYVALIDCRGDKAARRFFSRWHEIAHRMTNTDDAEQPVKRSTHDPLERVMDRIAGHVGFYEPILSPALARLMDGSKCLTFDVVETLRKQCFPEASFQATLSACNRTVSIPVIYIEATLAYKADDRREINSGGRWLFDDLRPEAKLRAVEVIGNTPAQRMNFYIAPNMRIPETSIIHRLYCDENLGQTCSRENLKEWTFSDGKRLEDRMVHIEVRRVKDRVLAIIQPVSDF